ncbi:MAG TPA: citrate synthase family protein [Gammaproteobacteria bacterium]|nr:citrate synthase family protein [Gammaproteobacteria bacterium]
MKADKSAWVDANRATELLGVSRATLYAYVSRGRIRSESAPGSTRRRRYARDDVERLLARTRERRNPEKAAEQALHWGLPILESAITLIGDGRIYYRGRDAAELARTAPLAEVAALIWTGKPDAGPLGDPPRGAAASAPRGSADAPFVARAQAALALAAPGDPLAYDLRPHAVARTGWRILHQLAQVAAGPSSEATIDAALAASWGVSRHVDLIRAALILCADHELNVSAFTARCVASAGSSPYAVVIAGLAALEGTKHGGTTVRMEVFWDELRRSARLRGGFADRLRRGEAIEGFGHPLYPGGDPRAAVLLARLPKTKGAKYARDLVSAARDVLGEAPNVDFALVALARALGLPDGAALTLFAIGRTIGWIGHAIEQYQQNAIIRPRAKYVGENPAS